MKLLLIMICDEDKERVLKKLVENGYSPTFIASTGSFLEYGKSLILLGVEEEKIIDVKHLINQYTRREQIIDGEELKANIYIIDSTMIKTNAM